MGEHNLLKCMFFQGCWTARASELGLAIRVWPPILVGHKFFVIALFWVFLDSMEIQLSQDSIHIYVEDRG